MASFYASALAVGGGTGTIGSPFTWAEMIAYINASFVNGDIAWIKGDGIYTGLAPFSITKAAVLATPCIMEGYATAPGDGGMATIQRSSPAASVFWTGTAAAYWIIKNITIDANSQGTNSMSPSATTIMLNCVFRRAGAGGVNGGNSTQLIGCKAELNTTYGMAGSILTNCIAVNNGTNGIYGDQRAWNCIAANNGTYGGLITASGGGFFNCIFNANIGGGISVGASVASVANCIISNHGAGQGILFSAGGVAFFKNNNFWNNNSNSNILGNLVNSSAVDPAFNNAAAFDFRRTTNDLAGLGYGDVGGINYETVPGIAPARLGSGVLPTFAGISGLVSNAEGTLLASWAFGANALYYEVYIQANTATGLFSTHANLCMMADDLQNSIVIKAMPNGTLLDYNTTYYVGIRAANSFGEDANLISLSAIPNNNVNVVAAAIKAQTDKLTFDGANNVHAVKNATDTAGTDFSATEKASITSAVPGVAAIQSGLALDATVAKTADTRFANLDASISSRLAGASYTAPDNATIASIQADTTTILGTLGSILTAIAGIPAAVWGYTVRTITSGGITPAQVWSYVTRTLTNGGPGGLTVIIGEDLVGVCEDGTELLIGVYQDGTTVQLIDAQVELIGIIYDC